MTTERQIHLRNTRAVPQPLDCGEDFKVSLLTNGTTPDLPYIPFAEVSVVEEVVITTLHRATTADDYSDLSGPAFVALRHDQALALAAQLITAAQVALEHTAAFDAQHILHLREARER